MITGLQLGRPGIYAAPAQDDQPLQAVRLDIAGLVGVALRGPTNTPVAVGSWSEYERLFGGYERGDGAPERLLPYAVAAFFAQGGARAHVLRLAPPPAFTGPTEEEATARFRLAHPSRYELAAADEGTWGDALRLRLDFDVAQSFTTESPDGVRLSLPGGRRPPDCSLLRFRRPDLPAAGVLRTLRLIKDRALGSRFGDLDQALPDQPDDGTDPVEVDVVTATLVASDPSSPVRREERITGLGLVAGHSRFVPDTLARESALCRAVGDWVALLPDPLLTPVGVEDAPVHGGADRSYGISYDGLFDPGDADADLLDEWDTHRGVDRMGRVSEVGILVVPDLTWRADPGPGLPVAPEPVRPRSRCDVCDPAAEPTLSALPPVPTGLDGRDPASLAEIVRRQQRLVSVAALRRRFVVLLDVPPGLPLRQVTGWRAGFDCDFAAAYYPWLGMTRPGEPASTAVSVPPSAFAAGIIAARERAHGVWWGPANELARGAVISADAVTDAIHDRLHPMGINVYRAERSGYRLSAARTLSSNPDYRQLSVRRLITQLAKTLEQQCQWLVFEPNTVFLRARLTHSITALLRDLHRQGALAGATEAESYFVRCDDSTNPLQSQQLGRLVAEIGVAPTSPIEFIVLRLSADVDGAVTVEAARG